MAGVSAVSASNPPIRGAGVRPIAGARAAGATRFGPSFGDSSNRRYAEEFGQLVVSRAEQAVVVRQPTEVGEVAGGTAHGAHEVIIAILKYGYKNFSISWSDFAVWGLFALHRGAAKAGRVARHTMACVVVGNESIAVTQCLGV
jgi:hypothetical protein